MPWSFFPPLLSALNSPRFCMQEQAYLRPTIVDGQWTQLRKYHAARTLSPLGALFGSEEDSLEHRHVRCSEEQEVAPCNTPDPFQSAAHSGKLWKHESFAARSLLPALERASARVHGVLRDPLEGRPNPDRKGHLR